MSNINWVTVFLGVLVFGGSLIYLMSPRPRKVRAPAVESKAASGPVKIVPKALKTYTAQEVAKHNLRNDCWIIVDGEVYDVTEYVDEHPGGDSITTNAGGDASVGVHGPQHPPSMWDVIKLYKIGTLAK